MKSVLISICPKGVDKIVSGEKTIEVRKTAPKGVPFKAYIYCTKSNDGYEWLYRVDNNGYGKAQSWHGKVIGEFICDEVYSIKNRGFCFSVAPEGESITDEIARQSCLDYYDMVNYLGNKDVYGWHISDLKIYDKPKELSDFCIPCKTNCEDCKKPLFYDCWKEKGKIKVVTRPPQSWQYVEELCKIQN